MPQVCTVCAHSERAAIERAHLDGQAVRAIARRCGLSRDAIMRHLDRHLPARMAKAAEKRQIAEGSDLIDRLLDLNRQTLQILATARKGGKADLALRAIGRAEAQLELQARLAGEIRDHQVSIVNVTLDPATAERMAALYLRRRAGSLAALPASPSAGAIEAVSGEIRP